MTVRTARPASDKQIALIARLRTERVLDTALVAHLEAAARAHADGALGTSQASTIIDLLFAAPRVPREAVAPLAEGFYLLDGVTYKVQTSRSTGGRYAKVLEGTRWAYAPGAIRSLANATPLTLEEAAAYGRRTGSCMVCGRTLTVAASIEAGIGPVCASRF